MTLAEAIEVIKTKEEWIVPNSIMDDALNVILEVYENDGILHK